MQSIQLTSCLNSHSTWLSTEKHLTYMFFHILSKPRSFSNLNQRAFWLDRKCPTGEVFQSCLLYASFPTTYECHTDTPVSRWHVMTQCCPLIQPHAVPSHTGETLWENGCADQSPLIENVILTELVSADRWRILTACPLSFYRWSLLQSLTGRNKSCLSCPSPTLCLRMSPTPHLTTTPASLGPTSCRGPNTNTPLSFLLLLCVVERHKCLCAGVPGSFPPGQTAAHSRPVFYLQVSGQWQQRHILQDDSETPGGEFRLYKTSECVQM